MMVCLRPIPQKHDVISDIITLCAYIHINMVLYVFPGISPASSKERVRDAHKKIMLLNHPDRGGSPYMATKINEAKEYLDSSGTKTQR